jgi:hypothetical protein
MNGLCYVSLQLTSKNVLYYLKKTNAVLNLQGNSVENLSFIIKQIAAIILHSKLRNNYYLTRKILLKIFKPAPLYLQNSSGSPSGRIEL